MDVRSYLLLTKGKDILQRPIKVSPESREQKADMLAGIHNIVKDIPPDLMGESRVVM